jgi:hypothetical protein
MVCEQGINTVLGWGVSAFGEAGGGRTSLRAVAVSLLLLIVVVMSGVCGHLVVLSVISVAVEGGRPKVGDAVGGALWCFAFCVFVVVVVGRCSGVGVDMVQLEHCATRHFGPSVSVKLDEKIIKNHKMILF